MHLDRRITKKHVIAFCFLGLFLILIVIGAVFFVTTLNKIDFVPSVSEPVTTINPVISAEPGDFAELGDFDGDGSELTQVTELILPKGNKFEGNSITNILLIGTDEWTAEFDNTARADSIMLLSLDTRKDTIKLVSIQRGTGVPIPGRLPDWLTHTFAYGGAPLTVQSVENAFLVSIDGYVRVNFKTFEAIVDAVGGVDIEMTGAEAAALNDEAYTNAVTRKRVSKGVNHLDGYDALQYSRLRFSDSDWVRIQRQRTVLTKMFEGAKRMGIQEIYDFANTVLPLVQTDLSRRDITSLMLSAPGLLGAEIEDMSLPVHGTFHGGIGEGGRVINVTDFQENSRILHEFLGD